jgi:hypothetical protein
MSIIQIQPELATLSPPITQPQLLLQLLNNFLRPLLLRSHLLSNGICSSLLLSLNLIRPSDCNIFGLVIAEEKFQDLFNDEAADVVYNHDGRHGGLEFRGEGDETHLFVNFGDEFCGAGKCDTGNTEDTPVHAAVF